MTIQEKKIDKFDTAKQTTFSELWLSKKMLDKIKSKGYEFPSAIQIWVIPLLLNWEKDIIWQAQTWTWKTAAFGLPVLERLDNESRDIQALILAPTRELAIQVAQELRSFADNSVNIQLLYWGQNIRDELQWLKRLPQIVVGTPWRVIDHLMKRKTLKIENLKYFILDEADEMLNIWFKEDIEEIIQYTPEWKKTLLFSATMPRWIKDIVHRYIKDHDLVSIEKKELTNSNIQQKCYKINARDKFEALCRVIEVEFDFYGIVFCKTKLDVDSVASNLMTRGYKVEWIHGDIDQKMREKTLARFKNWAIKILVATDVAARWIDVNNLTHVVNYSLPDNPEVYTHRIWRTGRAWNKWEAISFVSRKDSRILSWIERTIKTKLKIEKLPEVSDVIEFKKKRLLNNTKDVLWEKENLTYIDLASQLLELWDAEKVLASILKEWFWNEFSEIHYKNINTNSDFSDKTSNNPWAWIWEKRLFIAKWRLDNHTPSSLIQFIENEIGKKLWDIWKIDVMREFSFMNVKQEDAYEILDFFKRANPRKPLVVEAKWSSWFGWNRWWFRRNWSRGGFGNSSRWWYKWNSRNTDRKKFGRR